MCGQNQLSGFSGSRLVAIVAAVFLLGGPSGGCKRDEEKVIEKEKEKIERKIVLDDAEIGAVILHALWDDAAMNASDLRIDVEHGIATLEGRVDNLREKQRAVEITRNVKGVRSVIDRISVQPAIIPDVYLQRDVEQALLMDPATDAYEIVNSVKDGVVTLTGQVDSWAEQQLAEYVVSGVRGVKKIRNTIETKPAEVRPADEIRNDVAGRLAADALVDDDRIEVEVRGKVVKLSGEVGSAAEQARATRDAWVAGVEEVDDSGLKVALWERDRFRRTGGLRPTTREEIEKAVRDAFFRDPRVWPFELEVHVEGGIAILTGEVDSLAARHAAEQDARNTVGVWRVRNRLKVVPGPEVPTEVLAERVGNAIGRDPYLHAGDVHATVENGTVYVVGNVDSAFEKRHATAVLSRVTGVSGIENLLNIQRDETPKLDWEVESDVARNLKWSPYVKRDGIEIGVEAGVVELKGIVADWRAYREALQAAYRAGATAVRDNLLVREWPEGMKAAT
jgi:osmotically-inducible protein OsmY